LASGPHSLIFFYTMDPKRKRLETGPHSGLHNGKKIRATAAAAPEWTTYGRTMEPKRKKSEMGPRSLYPKNSMQNQAVGAIISLFNTYLLTFHVMFE